MKKIPHISLLLVSISVMIMVIALYVYMQYSIQASVSRAIAGNQIVHTEEATISQEQVMAKMYSTTVQDRRKMQSIFISSSEAISFIESIEKLGSYTGSEVTISGVMSDFTDSMPAGSFSKASARVEAVGSWFSVMRTLRLAETLPYQVSISNIRLNSSGIPEKGSSGEKRTWSLGFDISSKMIVTKNIVATSTNQI